MSGLYWDERNTKLKKFTSSTTSGPRGKSVVRIEVETTDPYELAGLLRQLEEAEQLQSRNVVAQSKRQSQTSPPRLALPAPALQLTKGELK